MREQTEVDPRLAVVEDEYARVRRALRRLALLHGVPLTPGVARMSLELWLRGVLTDEVYEAIESLRKARDSLLGLEALPADLLRQYAELARKLQRVLVHLLTAPVAS